MKDGFLGGGGRRMGRTWDFVFCPVNLARNGLNRNGWAGISGVGRQGKRCGAFSVDPNLELVPAAGAKKFLEMGGLPKMELPWLYLWVFYFKVFGFA